MTTLRRIGVTLLLAVQAAGGGAITLAHARDAAPAPPGVEAGHDGRCAILHDELRCALCHYAGARVVPEHGMRVPAPVPVRARIGPAPLVVVIPSRAYATAAARAPPLLLS